MLNAPESVASSDTHARTRKAGYGWPATKAGKLLSQAKAFRNIEGCSGAGEAGAAESNPCLRVDRRTAMRAALGLDEHGPAQNGATRLRRGERRMHWTAESKGLREDPAERATSRPCHGLMHCACPLALWLYAWRELSRCTQARTNKAKSDQQNTEQAKPLSSN